MRSVKIYFSLTCYLVHMCNCLDFSFRHRISQNSVYFIHISFYIHLDFLPIIICSPMNYLIFIMRRSYSFSKGTSMPEYIKHRKDLPNCRAIVSTIKPFHHENLR